MTTKCFMVDFAPKHKKALTRRAYRARVLRVVGVLLVLFWVGMAYGAVQVLS